MTVSLDRRRYRVAVHESGHAAVSYMCGFTGAGPVTIDPGRAYGGVTLPGHARNPSARDLATRSRPVPLQAAGLRRYREQWLMTAVAGMVAEDVLVWATTLGPVPDTPDAQVEAAVDRLPRDLPRELPRPAANLPRREADLLAAAAAASDVESDADQVAAVLAMTHIQPHGAPARAYLRWVTAEVREMIETPPGLEMVHDLAAALMDRATLSAREWRAICRAAS